MQIGPYRVERELARGGAGVVYRARDERDGALVALKLERFRSPVARRRFRTEAQALLRLQHPNLARAREAGEHEGASWLALDLVPGESLGALLARGKVLPPARAVEVVRSLCDALEYAHGCGVLHRDVKPDNVVLRPDGEPVLVDFGLARDLDSELSRVSQTGVFLGTPGYWSPEQARGDVHAIGPAADVYGLGATLYALIAGHPPVLSDTLAGYLHSGSFQRVVPLTERHARVSPRLWSACARSLAFDPAARFPSPAAFARALAEGDAPARPRSAAWAAVVGSLALAVALVVGAAWGLRTAAPAGTAAPPRPAATPPPEPELPRASTAPPSALDGLALQRDVEARVAVQDLAGARDRVLAAREAHPQHPLPWVLSAKLQFEEGRPGAALEHLQRALTLSPDFPDALYTRGVVLQYLGYARDAHADMTRLLALRKVAPALRSASQRVLDELRATIDRLGLDRTPSLRGDEARQRLVRAQAAYDRDDPHAAHVALDEAILLAPELPALWEWRARAHLRQKDLVGARDAALRAIELDPTSDSAARHLASALARLGAEEQALPYVQRAVAAFPDAPDVRFAQTLTLLFLERPAEALEAAQRLVTLDTSQSEHWVLLGAAQLLSGRTADGAETLQRTRRSLSARNSAAFDAWVSQVLERLGLEVPTLETSDARARAHARIEELARTRRSEEARALLEAQFADHDAVYFGLRGVIALYAASPQEALDDFDRALDLAPGLHAARLTRAQLTRDLFLLERAWDDLLALEQLTGSSAELLELRGQAAQLRPDLERKRALQRAHDPRARRFLALAEFARGANLAQQGQLQAAYQVLSGALLFDPFVARAWALRGLVRSRFGPQQGALFDVTRATDLAPDDPSGWVLRGQLHAQARAWEASIADLERALALTPDDAEALRVYGRSLGGAKRYADSARALERALALEPGFPQEWVAYATALWRLERDDEVPAALEQARRYATRDEDRAEVERLAGELEARLQRPR